LDGSGTDNILSQQDAGGKVIWSLADAQGTVRDLVDSSGNVADHVKFGAFGLVVSQTNAASSNRYLYTGREFDAETGLYYYRARYYDPEAGRFLGRDPLGSVSDDTNLYRYVQNNPLNRVDPTGLLSIPSGDTRVYGAYRQQMYLHPDARQIQAR